MAIKNNTPKNKSRKAKNAPPRRVVTEDIKSLQKQFRKLKKLGLTKSKKKATVKNVSSSAIQKILGKFGDVLSGKTAPVKVTPKKAKAYKKAGFQVFGHRVLIEKVSPEERIYQSHSKKSDDNIVRVQRYTNGSRKAEIIPTHPATLLEYFEDLARHPEKIGKKPKGGAWGFRYHGNAMKQPHGFNNVEQMVHFLQTYTSIREATANNNMDDVLKHLEFFTITRDQIKKREAEVNVFGPANATGRSGPKRDSHRSTRNERRLRYKAINPGAYEAYLTKQRERAKEYRAKKRTKKNGDQET